MFRGPMPTSGGPVPPVNFKPILTALELRNQTRAIKYLMANSQCLASLNLVHLNPTQANNPLPRNPKHMGNHNHSNQGSAVCLRKVPSGSMTQPCHPSINLGSCSPIQDSPHHLRQGINRTCEALPLISTSRSANRADCIWWFGQH